MPETKHLVAGRGSMASISKLLGLGSVRGGWRLESLCAMGEENVRLGIKNGKARLAFFLLPKAAQGSLLKPTGLSISVEGAPGPALRRFLKIAASKLGKRNLKDIVSMIAGDPETFTEDAPSGHSEGSLCVPIATGPIGLMEAGWRNFFGDQDFEVTMGFPELSMNKTLYVRYSDRECLYSWAAYDPRRWSFLDYPVRGAPSPDVGPANFSRGVIMEIDESDVILGTTKKVEKLIAKVGKTAKDARFLLVNHFCTPVIIGDDLEGLARRCGVPKSFAAINWRQQDRDRLDTFGEFFRSLFAKPGFFDAPADKNAVNLFHFPIDYREEELSPLLGEIGVKVNMRMFPDVDFTSCKRLPRARRHIFCEATSYPAKVREALIQHGQTVVTAPAPYGLGGSRESIRTIAAAVGREKAFEKAWEKRLKAVMPEWERLKVQARKHRLAFVVSEATLPRLYHIRHGQGAPLMPMLAEMGFGLDILFYDPHCLIPELPPGSPPAGVRVFRTPQELERELKEGGFQAVYSDIFFDWRISSAGKARFSSRDFEMGLAGALRSLRRLLERCRLPFYGRYGAHLERKSGRIPGSE